MLLKTNKRCVGTTLWYAFCKKVIRDFEFYKIQKIVLFPWIFDEWRRDLLKFQNQIVVRVLPPQKIEFFKIKKSNLQEYFGSLKNLEQKRTRKTPKQ